MSKKIILLIVDDEQTLASAVRVLAGFHIQTEIIGILNTKEDKKKVQEIFLPNGFRQ